jgi:predicted transcriptional regulator
MIDGKPYKTLKRHLGMHGLTPAQYRERYGLKSDYPMVAENYAEMRRGLAKKIGLGRKPGTKVAASNPANKAKTSRTKANGSKSASMDAPAQS